MPSAPEFDRLVTEWLGDRPEADVLANLTMINLYRTAMWCEADFEATVHRPLGWSWAGFRLMHCLLVIGPMLTGELARTVYTTAATVSSVVTTLEKRGLVRRERDRNDRRLVRVHLTEDGRALLSDVMIQQIEREKEWFGDVDPEDLHTFLRVLRTVGEGARRRRTAAAAAAATSAIAIAEPADGADQADRPR